ncbi:DUF2218 domain-containing protein [Streptomyces sp. 2A115]|uniref:DUF2218 domain-containing protein n=1 Tax=Streptomyces sp. 2A115 TaxID=3457439 RepID=UPI003FD34FF7
MPIAEARVETERASRYLVQLCRHAQQMRRRHFRPRAHAGGGTHTPPEVHHVEWSDTHGTVRLSLGQWTLRATPDALVLRADAANEEDLRRMRSLVAARVEKIGRRDDLTVVWQRTEAPSAHSGTDDRTDGPHPPVPEESGHAGAGTRRRTLKAVGAVAALIVAAHLVLGGSVLAASQWLGWGTGAIGLAVVLVKVIGVGGFAARHRHRRAR